MTAWAVVMSALLAVRRPCGVRPVRFTDVDAELEELGLDAWPPRRWAGDLRSDGEGVESSTHENDAAAIKAVSGVTITRD
jgi:hypothetical protein